MDTIVLLQQTGELYEAIDIALEVITDPSNIGLILIATLFGLILGVLPGVGGPIGLALLIPVTFYLDPNVAIMILTSTLGGTAFGGSISAILINTPGSPPNAASVLDGYPLARQGRAGEALAASAVSSAGGAIVGVIILIISIPFVREIALAFGSPEIFWLAVVGLTTIAVATSGSFLLNLIAGAFGLLLAFHGYNPITGSARFTWGIPYLRDGIPLIPVIIGIFAISEMINLLSKESKIRDAEKLSGESLKGIIAVKDRIGVFLRSSVIGWFIGVLPGAGGTVANFIAYIQAKQSSSNPDSFGEGNISGLIASESSNDAKDGGAMIPTLGLGIPGSTVHAVLLGAFVIHGITPGPLLFEENLQLVFIISFTLVISNVITSIIGLLTAETLAKITNVKIAFIAPPVLAIAFVGSYAIRLTFIDVIVAFIFGIFGFFMIKYDISRVAIIIALVLGPISERNFHRSLQISRGDYSIFYNSVPSALLISLILIIVAIPLYKKFTNKDSLIQ